MNTLVLQSTTLFSLLKSIGIFVVSGFIDIQNLRFNPSVSNTSFDTDFSCYKDCGISGYLVFAGSLLGRLLY